MAELPPAMLAILKELSKPGACAHFMPYMGSFRPDSYYFVSTAMKRCTSQIRGLIKRGLAETFNHAKYGADHKARITKEGRRLLAPPAQTQE